MNQERYAWGAVPTENGLWRFRLWAPGVGTLALRLDGLDHAMAAEGDGWFSLVLPANEGVPYQFILPDGLAVPDPASRRQAGDVHGPSLLTPPQSVPLAGGRRWEEAVILELHVGTFTPEGTFAAAAAELADLAALGITAIEIMPVAQFAGDRGWGYDGTLPYTPHPAYGTPDDLRALVKTAHAHGLMVLLDVVYNHFGPEGNYLHAYAPAFFDAERMTPWGAGIDYSQAPVRRFFIENALYWLEEFGFDGLRLDAIDQIQDRSEVELLAELALEARRRLPNRPVHLTTEDNRNVTHLHDRGPDGEVVLYTAEWNDDFHNAAHVVATGEAEGYYASFADRPLGHMARALAEGFSFQGERGRGAPSAHLPPDAFINFLQNHDQTGNRALGERLAAIADPDMLHALTAILLLSPHIPMLFMGEEYGETRPFFFFAGFTGDLAQIVTEGRRREFADFAGFTGDAATVPDPIDISTFTASKLDRSHRDTPEGQTALARVKTLLALRAAHIVPHLPEAMAIGGRILGAENGVLAIDWQLSRARLQLRANLSQFPRTVPPASGDELYRSDAPGSPRSAAFWLDLSS